jgi:hypothetical protein
VAHLVEYLDCRFDADNRVDGCRDARHGHIGDGLSDGPNFHKGEGMRPARTLDELEHNVEAHLELVRVQAWCAGHRRKVLAMPIPRNECPGCFSTIYDGAAEQGWCCDCYQQRARYTDIGD